MSEQAIAQPIQLIPQKALVPQVEEDIIGLPPSSLQEEEDKKDFWEGTPPSIIKTYFSKIPVRLDSPALRALRTEVLKEKYIPLAENLSYTEERLSLLEKTGQFDAARDFLSETSLPDKEKWLIELQWQRGESKKACEKIANLIRSSSDLEWKKENIYCLYAHGEEERGKVALELLKESNSEDFSLLNALFDLSSPPPFDPALARSPFLLTVWGETGQEIPEDDLDQLSPASLALLVRLEKTPSKTRFLAAAKAFSAGSLGNDAILNLLKAAPEESLLRKFEEAFRAQKVGDLLPLFEEASQKHALGFIAAAFTPHLAKIEPSLEALSLAPYLIRAFLENRDKALTARWATFYRREAPDEAIAVLPLLHLFLAGMEWTEAYLQGWQAYQKRVHPAEAVQYSYALRRLFQALGKPPGPSMEGESPPPSWRQEKALFEEDSLDLLEAAVESARKGEVLLLTLALIGETPLGNVSPDKIARIIEALKKVGSGDEAHFLALDFLLARGL